MGRRSINTTKSGKYMNPTDQARKEARKKELKKNKRQRQMVRAAVLKNKDPAQILEEMEKIDEMEYNVLQPSPLNEKVLRDKRKKLKETFDRVMRLYQSDEPEHWADLKRKEVEYEKKRLKKQQYYESVKHAQSVQVDEIPLPAPPTATGSSAGSAVSSSGLFSSGASIRIPPPPMTLALPPFAPSIPPGVAKNSESMETQTEKTRDSDDKDWIDVPPFPPPNLFIMSELDSDAEDNTDYDENEGAISTPKLRSPSRKEMNNAQQRLLGMSGQNIDDFMKEMEHVHKSKHRKLQKDKEISLGDEDEADADLDSDGDIDHDDGDVSDDERKHTKRLSDSKSHGVIRQRLNSSSNDSNSSDNNHDDSKIMDNDTAKHAKPLNVPVSKTNEPTSAPARALSIAGPLPAPPVAPSAMPPIPLPPVPTVPGPPQMSIPTASLPPHMHNIGPPPPGLMFRPPPLRPLAPGLPGFGLRVPPGPPPGPRAPHALGPIPPRMGIRMPPGPPPGLPPRLPNLLKSGMLAKDPTKGVTTITAKPKIRNLSADVTRFVPSTLRVKREDSRRPARPKQLGGPIERGTQISTDGHKPPTKDDAYLQFMNEMQGLL